MDNIVKQLNNERQIIGKRYKMKYKCITCKSIIIISAYKKSFKNETYNCPVCGDMMLYKPNKKRGIK